MDSEPPLFRIFALEMEMAGVKMVDKMRMVGVEISCRFRVDVCMRLETCRPEDTYRELFGPRNICAESNTTLFVEMEPAIRPLATVVKVLALVKHWILEVVVTRP